MKARYNLCEPSIGNHNKYNQVSLDAHNYSERTQNQLYLKSRQLKLLNHKTTDKFYPKLQLNLY